jgi:hypothetical protein
MPYHTLWKAVGVITAFAAIIVAGMLNNSRAVRAHDDDNASDNARIQRGFEIAPFDLDVDERDRNLVGLGSYIVNAVADCNGCHSAGPATEFAKGGNPYFLSPPFTGKKKLNMATYLAGGRDFGPVGSVLHLYSRNLTPDKSGLPAGGRTYEQFVDIMRDGEDFDDVHANCTAPGTPPNCFQPPFNGDHLQVMRWPFFKDMTDHDLRAIYAYLKAVPCNPGPTIAGAPYLRNACQ